MQRKKNHPDSLLYCKVTKLQRDCKIHLPSAVQVALTHAALLGQGGRAEPEGWDTMIVAVSLVPIVTTEISHECITVPIH